MDDSESELQKRFAANLRKTRLDAGFSQEALAAKAGLDRTYISSCERCIRNPSIRTVERIANALSIAPADLLK